MELLERIKLNQSKNILNIGTDFKREFALSRNIVKFSILIPLMLLKELDYFSINLNQVKNKSEFNDVIFFDKGTFNLVSMEVIDIMNNKAMPFAKLLYAGNIKGYKNNNLYNFNPINEITFSRNSDFDNMIALNNKYVKLY